MAIDDDVSIKFGGRLVFRKRKQGKTEKSYLQYFKRGSTVFIQIARRIITDDRIFTTNYTLRELKPQLVPFKMIKDFLKGPLLLTLDLKNADINPLIAECDSFLPEGRAWALLTYPYKGRKACIPKHILRAQGLTYISPVLHIDLLENDENYISSVSSHSDRIDISKDENSIVLFIGAPNVSKERVLHIPVVEGGYFKPKNIFGLNAKDYEFQLSPGVPSSSVVYINVGGTETWYADVVVLANLKRGSWYYTQHAIANLRHRSEFRVKVVNSTFNFELYEEHPEEYITHVDVFDNLIDHMQFVVVNMLVCKSQMKSLRTMDDYETVRNVYSRDVQNNPSIYTHHSTPQCDCLIDKLYNINVDEPILDIVLTGPNTLLGCQIDDPIA
uniref:Uncharacterized protein n=2 Tax=Babesia bovis TaxID=5865 RepID=A7ATT8_BABBO|eukprot:XP_001609917.1 hypothetical protein [Babesia bovis T2Bo]